MSFEAPNITNTNPEPIISNKPLSETQNHGEQSWPPFEGYQAALNSAKSKIEGVRRGRLSKVEQQALDYHRRRWLEIDATYDFRNALHRRIIPLYRGDSSSVAQYSDDPVTKEEMDKLISLQQAKYNGANINLVDICTGLIDDYSKRLGLASSWLRTGVQDLAEEDISEAARIRNIVEVLGKYFDRKAVEAIRKDMHPAFSPIIDTLLD